LQAGIDGMKYPSAIENDNQTGAMNYVVFDDSQVTIHQHVAFSKVKKPPVPPSAFAGDLLKNAADAYKEGETKRSWRETVQGIREYIQDMNLPVRKFEEQVLMIGGKQDNKSKPYRDMSLAFGRQERLYKEFFEDKMKPVLKSISDIVRSNVPGEFILPYVISKEATQRNPRMRAAEIADWAKKNPNEDTATIEEELKNKDYSGVMSFDTKGDYDNPDKLAQAIVAELEGRVGKEMVDNLWDNMRKATTSILDAWEAGGQITPDQKKQYLEEDKYFVPLRGWREGAAKELAYAHGEGFSNSLQHAEGRKSLAENPLAYILHTAFQAIGEQVDNEVKKSMLNLILKNMKPVDEAGMATIKNLYYVKEMGDGGEHEWRPTIDRPSKKMFESGDAVMKLNNDYGRLRKPSQAHEHEVMVRRTDGDVIMIFKDKQLPVAQALNKQNYMIRTIFGKVKDARDMNKGLAGLGVLNNYMKATMTSYNVVFPFTNFLRDIQEASTTQFIEGENPFRLIGNMPGAFPALIRQMAGKQNINIEADRHLKRFYEIGGATGFTHLKTPQDIEKDVDKEIARMVEKGTLKGSMKGVAHHLLSAVTTWNMIFEDATRFSAYLSALKEGFSEEDAAYKGKEATVNFDRKGKGSSAWDAVYAFFNASNQSLQKGFKLAKDHSLRFLAVASSFALVGFIEALMNSLTDDPENPEDNYYNLSPYMRENYLIIPNLPRLIEGKNKGNRYLSIPLSQFWRGFKSVGSIAFDIVNGKMDIQSGITTAMSNFIAGLTAFDIGGFIQNGKPSIAPLVPTVLTPFYENATNRNFMNVAIAKEPFTKEQEKMIAEAHLGKNNVNPAIKFFTDLLFRAGGGDNDTKYFMSKEGVEKKVPEILDYNPSFVENLLKGYTGGTGAVLNDLITTVLQAVTPGEEINFKNVPFVNKFLRQTPEAKWNIISEYYSLKEPVEVHQALEKQYEGQAETGKVMHEKIEKYKKTISNPYYIQYDAIFNTYDKQITELKKDESFNPVDGSKRAIELMEECNDKIKTLKIKYNK
jgi:hypothetical protein